MAMRRYLNTARRLWALLAVVLVLAWAPGLYAAYGEYTTTFESDATVWVQRTTSQIS